MPWAAVAGAVISSYSAQKQQDKAKKDAKDLTKDEFGRERWLAEQQRKWNLEDRKYKEDAIAGFRGFAPDKAKTFNGVAFQNPAPTSTAGLADFDPNDPNALRNKKPVEYGLRDEDYAAKPKPLMAGGM